MTDSINRDDILALAKKKFKLIPIVPRNKIPQIPSWQKNASSDPKVIKNWFSSYRGCNWGIVTGDASQIIAVDIDTKSGGTGTWEQWGKEHDIPATVTVRTGTNGRHYYFRYPSDMSISNSASKIGQGIDIRGNNGQVIVPPSIHPNGQPYQWEPGLSPFDVKVAMAPDWLLKLLAAAEGSQGSGAPIGKPMQKGTRNDRIYNEALNLADRGSDEEFIKATIYMWLQAAGEHDMPEDEVEATIASALKHSRNKQVKRADQDDVEYNDVGNAKRLVDLNADDILYVSNLGWFVWDGKVWQPDEENQRITQLAIESIHILKQELYDLLSVTTSRAEALEIHKKIAFANSSNNVTRLKAMIDIAKSDPRICVSHTAMDDSSTEYLLNLDNGVYDLLKNELRPHDRSLRITRLAPTKFKAGMDCPNFKQTLHYAFNGDEEMIDYFQQCLGYSISASMNERTFFICHGASGRNGKSTLLEAVHTVLGESTYAMTASAEALIFKGEHQSTAASSALASLRGIRIASISEFPAGKMLNEELIKQLTGGDQIMARKLYKEVFAYRPVFKIWIRSNHDPVVRDTGEPFWARIKKIPFEGQIPMSEDIGITEMKAKLLAESEGILAWLIEGFNKWNDNGRKLIDPQKVEQALADYKTDQDIFAQFLEEYTVEDEEGWVSRKELYKLFHTWCTEEQGIRFVMTMKAFSTGIAAKLNQYAQRKKGTTPVWLGIRLNDEAESQAAMTRMAM